MRYSSITPLGLSGRASKTLFYSQNAGIFTGTQNNIIRIPITSSTAFLDPKLTALEMLYTNLATKKHQFDSSGHSLIKRMRIISSSTGAELEDIREYDHLMSMLSDCQMGVHTRAHQGYSQGYGNIGAYFNGTPQTGAVAEQKEWTQETLKAEVAKANANTVIIASQVASVGSVATAPVTSTMLGTGEIEVKENESFKFILPLALSAVIGGLQAKYLPLFLCGGLLLEIELNQYPTIGANDAGECKYQISGVKLHTELLEFDATINSALTTMCQQSGLYLHATCWSSYANSINSKDQSIMINERLKSVKSVFQTFAITRGKNDLGAANGQAATPWMNRSQARTHAYVKSFQLKFGSQFYPTQKITGKSDATSDNSEYLYELQKAMGHYGDLSQATIINNVNFADSSSVLASCGKAVYAIDTDLFTSEPLESGINTILNNPLLINIEQEFAFVGTAYTHLLYDAIFTISPTGSFTVSK
jgi:hypothetical protein